MSVPGYENEAYWRQRLLDMRTEVDRLIADNLDNALPVELDQSRVGRLSRMDAMQVQAMAKAAETRRMNGRERIDRALLRLEENEFGACLRCGEDIALKRLDIDPTTPFCLACASK